MLVRDNMAYPIFQFRCSGVEKPAEANETCPMGSGCDAQHYHASAVPLGRVAPTGVSDVEFDASGFFAPAPDPEPCFCGWGKVSEADVRTLSVFVSDIEQFVIGTALNKDSNLTDAEQLNADPCGG
jgi:hypothetical protein